MILPYGRHILTVISYTEHIPFSIVYDIVFDRTYALKQLMEQSLDYTPKASGTERSKTIVIAGASGHLGQKIATYLLCKGAKVIALVRVKSNSGNITQQLQEQGAHIIEVNYDNKEHLTEALKGADCLVSAVSGLEDVIIGLQTKLLHAAMEAGVPRFIPSDYCIDYTKLPYGNNRNLNLRKAFNEQLDGAPIAATSVLNGMFTDLLTGQAPVVLFKIKRILYWGRPDQLLDFTTMDNTAAFTALVALDNNTPRYLRIAGDVLSAEGLCTAASKAMGEEYRLLKAGSLGMFKIMIKVTRTLFPKKEEVFPPWQGMQYMYDMFSGKPKLSLLDNDRYAGIHWTSVREVLEKKTIQSPK